MDALFEIVAEIVIRAIFVAATYIFDRIVEAFKTVFGLLERLAKMKSKGKKKKKATS